MIKSIAGGAILTSKLTSNLNLLVLMYFHPVNCASKILNPLGAPVCNSTDQRLKNNQLILGKLDE